MCVIEASIKRREQVRSLDHLYPGVKIDKKKVTINATLLVSRLIHVAIAQREEDTVPVFDYELTTIPTALFKDNAMHKNEKAQLARAIKQAVQPSERSTQTYSMFLRLGPPLCL